MGMANKTENIQIMWKIMQMLEGEQIETALSDAFELLIKNVEADTGAIWLLNPGTKKVTSAIAVGKAAIAGFSIEAGKGLIKGPSRLLNWDVLAVFIACPSCLCGHCGSNDSDGFSSCQNASHRRVRSGIRSP